MLKMRSGAGQCFSPASQVLNLFFAIALAVVFARRGAHNLQSCRACVLALFAHYTITHEFKPD
jgi:hypothetical protein